ncbi:MAG: hypothetical protein R3B93_01375 [Bacteroidia bacterium]
MKKINIILILLLALSATSTQAQKLKKILSELYQEDEGLLASTEKQLLDKCPRCEDQKQGDTFKYVSRGY